MSSVRGSLIFSPNECHHNAAEKFSDRLVIAVPVLIIRFFHISNRSHPCCIYLADYASAFLMVVSASTSLFFNVLNRCYSERFLTGTGNVLLIILFHVSLLNLNPYCYKSSLHPKHIIIH